MAYESKKRDRVIIPEEIFIEYWTEKEKIEKQLRQYTKILCAATIALS
jgi:hypothetical protein